MTAETFTSQGIVEDVRRGLQDHPKWLSSLYFYDEEGSRLFDAICQTPEYYPTRTEEAILKRAAAEILDAAGDDLLLAEMGSGSSTKTKVILDALLRRQGPSRYAPIDVSADFLDTVARRLEKEHAGLEVEPVAAEYKAGLERIGAMPAARRLVLFLGSSIGNFEPDEQAALLRAAHDALSPGDALLIGTDKVKPKQVLDAAYNDRAGITAQFNKNILTHLNRELDGDADPDAFDHVAFYDEARHRIEMHLRSRRAQRVRFRKADLVVDLAEGEMIHTENSYKFAPEDVERLVEASGWRREATWEDPKGWFCLTLLRRPED